MVRRPTRLRRFRYPLGIILCGAVVLVLAIAPAQAATPTVPPMLATAIASGKFPTPSGAQQTAIASGTFPAMPGGPGGAFPGGTPPAGLPTPSSAQQTAIASGTFPAGAGSPSGAPSGGNLVVPVAATSGGGACTPLSATTTYASPAFGTQREAGETLVKNFWGPAETAGLQEAYREATGGMRLVQYFDKGRMELADGASGTVTFGLLATELITGQMQMGASSFAAKAPPAIPIAGDPDGDGPTYAALAGNAASLLAGTNAAVGVAVKATVGANGGVTAGDGGTGSGPTAISGYDMTTRHNVPQAFATFRDKVGLATVGYAKSEPFLATVKVGGAQKQVMIQIFERRVLTYTASNSPEFQVEMGNIGQHYYRWRYCA